MLGLDKDFSGCDLPADSRVQFDLNDLRGMYERLPESRREAVMRSVHSGRPCRPEEVAQAIVWLGTASPAYLNGATLDVNDGSYPRQGDRSKLAPPLRGGTMALKATKADVWVVTLEDRPGGAAGKLEALAKAGANLEMVLARRTETPGQGVMFVTPIKGAKATKAAQDAGMARPANIYSVRIEGGDKPGLGSRIARALGNAGINFRGMSGVAMGKKFVSYIALDSAEDQAKAVAVLKKVN